MRQKNHEIFYLYLYKEFLKTLYGNEYHITLKQFYFTRATRVISSLGAFLNFNCMYINVYSFCAIISLIHVPVQSYLCWSCCIFKFCLPIVLNENVFMAFYLIFITIFSWLFRYSCIYSAYCIFYFRCNNLFHFNVLNFFVCFRVLRYLLSSLPWWQMVYKNKSLILTHTCELTW